MSSSATIVARLVHLSDLHFGLKDPQSVWDLLHKHVTSMAPAPTGIVVTGDIVNTPKEAHFKKAVSALRSFGAIPVFVCPGNHDRYLYGNKIGWWRSPGDRDFYYFFKDSYIAAPRFKVVPLGPRITARLIAIDSSDDTSFFARSFVGARTFADLREGLRCEPDPLEKGKLNLRIVLTHHHLLPMPPTEGRADTLWGPFQTATTLTVNAGAVLNVLSEEHVDLVLHGHEHVFNVARYTTMQNRLGNVTVIACGSSTGTETAKGWTFDKAGFNVLDVKDDDSIWLTRYSGKSGAFVETERHQLFEAVDLRRTRFHLAHKVEEGEAQGLKIHFRFLENRDAVVHRSYSNVILKNSTFAFNAFSDTGTPRSPRAWVVDDDGQRIEGDVGNGFKKTANDSWRCEVTFPMKSEPTRRTLVTTYTWSNAVMLSEAHVDAIPPSERNVLYQQYLEHTFSGIPASISAPAFLEIAVDLPQQWAPDDIAGNILAFTSASAQPPVLSKSLSKSIYSNGEGHMSLRVTFPDPGTRYYLAWRVRREKRSDIT